jgi:hypothetical protein
MLITSPPTATLLAEPAGVLKPLEETKGPLVSAPAGVLNPFDELCAPAGVLKLDSAEARACANNIKTKAITAVRCAIPAPFTDDE